MSIVIRPVTGLGRVSGASGAVADRWPDALAKLVPGEVILVFAASAQAVPPSDSSTARVTMLAACAALVPVLLWCSARRAGVAAPALQYMVRTLSLLLYVGSTDAVLALELGKWTALLCPGTLVVLVLAALSLSPPGAQRPPRQKA